MPPEVTQPTFLPSAFEEENDADDDNDFFIDAEDSADENPKDSSSKDEEAPISLPPVAQDENDDEHPPAIEEETIENKPSAVATEASAPSTQDTTTIEESSSLSVASLPRIPSKPILKTSVDESIPICTKRKSWKTLPKPNMDQIKMKRVESLNSFFHPQLVAQQQQQQQQQDSPDSPKMKRSNSKVAFQDVLIREYDTTIGDNPSVSMGTPLSLDWNYQENEPLDLDLYEANRGKRRGMRQMYLNYFQRKNILIHKWGYTEQEVKDAKRQVRKTKSQRDMTSYLMRSFPPLAKMEEAGESLVRKTKRALRRSSKSGKDSNSRTTIQPP